MAEIAQWSGHSFTVSPVLIRGFTGLTLKGSSETEDKISDSQKVVQRKNANPDEISLTAELNALTGCNVRSEALAFIADAREGKSGYFYLGGEKLLPYQLMLTEADVSETVIAPNGTWISCKVRLTMRQCEKTAGGSGGSGGAAASGGSKKASVKTTGTSQGILSPIFHGIAGGTISGVSNLIPTVSSAVNSGIGALSGILSKASSEIIRINLNSENAKKSSSTAKKASVAGSVTVGKRKVAYALH